MSAFEVKSPWAIFPPVFVCLKVVVLSAGAGVASAQTSVRTEGPSRTIVQEREIDDRSLGIRWLLVRDSDHPGAPGRLVYVPDAQRNLRALAPSEEPTGKCRAIALPLHPVIRGGDTLIVEDDTGIATARFEAVALAPAAAGSVLEARLKIHGTPVKVIAVAAGRARLASRLGVQP